MRKVLVLGGSSDIGVGIVEEYLERGWSVVAHGNSWSGKASTSIYERPDVIKFDLDLRDLVQVEEFIQSEKELIEVDSIINCIGNWKAGSYLNQSIDEIEDSFRANVFSPFLFVRAAIPRMRSRRWGRIVHLGSIGVKYGGGRNNVAYSWSKYSLEFIPAEFADWAKDHVFINIARIGVTDTRIHQLDSSKDMVERIMKIPIQRMATTKEVAKAVIWLGSDDNQLITGQVVPISGGE